MIPFQFSADPEPEVQDCRFFVSNQEGSLNLQSNVSKETFEERTKTNQPIDCMWIINVTKGWKVSGKIIELRSS